MGWRTFVRKLSASGKVRVSSNGREDGKQALRSGGGEDDLSGGEGHEKGYSSSGWTRPFSSQ